jgi:hypothetical protein
MATARRKLVADGVVVILIDCGGEDAPACATLRQGALQAYGATPGQGLPAQVGVNRAEHRLPALCFSFAIHLQIAVFLWRARQDSNLRPSDS